MNSAQIDKRIRLNKVLFLTDFSTASERALPFVCDVAREYNVNVSVLHVLVPDVLTNMTPDSPEAAIELQKEFALSGMRQVETHLARVPSQTAVVAATKVWAAVEPVLTKEHIDLVVLGTSGRTGLPKLLLGSTAEEIFRRSPVPVMTISPSVDREYSNGARWEHVVFASDFTPESLAAAPYAISFAEENDAQLTLLHVIPSPGQHKGTKKQGLTVAEAMHQLDEIVSPDVRLWCRRENVVEIGEPAEQDSGNREAKKGGSNRTWHTRYQARAGGKPSRGIHRTHDCGPGFVSCAHRAQPGVNYDCARLVELTEISIIKKVRRRGV